MFVQWEDRIFSILGDRSFLAARLYYCYIIFYYVWAEPLLIVLLSKTMGGGGCEAMIFAAAQAIFWPTGIFWCLSLMLVYVDAFYLRKPGKIPYVLVFNLRVLPRVGTNRRVCITAF